MIKSYDERVYEWREAERLKRLDLDSSIKKKITKKLIKTFIDMMVYQELDNEDTIGDYRAYGQNRLAGGLKRSSDARVKRFFSEYKRIFGETFKTQLIYRAVWAYLEEKYQKQIKSEFKKEFKRRFGYIPKDE